jgi:uncharacterized membrane protein
MAQIERAALKSAAKSQLKGNLGFLLIAYVLCFCHRGNHRMHRRRADASRGTVRGRTSREFCLAFVRGAERPSINNLFDGFRQFLGAFVAYLLTVIFTVLGCSCSSSPAHSGTPLLAGFLHPQRPIPNSTASRRSKNRKEMMKGHKGELFVLLLSFFWWFLLGCVTLGIASSGSDRMSA